MRNVAWQPLVSIITPSYNQGEFIEDAILCIKGQTYPHIEHIIVDGASSDNTLNVIKQYDDNSYNLRWVSEPDKGMYDAINKGIRMAKGDILAYLNCDDIYFSWTVKTAVAHLVDSYIVYGDLLRLDEHNNAISPLFSMPYHVGYYNSFGFISQPTVFFRREVLDEVGQFDGENYSLVADCEYWLRCARNKIYPVKIWEFMAIEREHVLNQRSVKAKRLQEEIVKLRQEYSAVGKIDFFIYRVINHFFWRIMLISYKISMPPSSWSLTRKGEMLKMDWLSILNEWMPGTLQCSDMKPRNNTGWKVKC